LKQIALALHNYADDWNAFPPAFTVDADGNPLHSWRTLLLPYLDYAALYGRIDLSKPWDAPANAEVFRALVTVYQCPSADCPQTHTTYLAIVGEGSCFPGAKPFSPKGIRDGRSQTLMVVEVDNAQAVPWMAPRDADEAILLNVGRRGGLAHEGGFHGAFVDGSVLFLSAQMSAADRRALIFVFGNDK